MTPSQIETSQFFNDEYTDQIPHLINNELTRLFNPILEKTDRLMEIAAAPTTDHKARDWEAISSATSEEPYQLEGWEVEETAETIDFTANFVLDPIKGAGHFPAIFEAAQFLSKLDNEEEDIYMSLKDSENFERKPYLERVEVKVRNGKVVLCVLKYCPETGKEADLFKKMIEIQNAIANHPLPM